MFMGWLNALRDIIGKLNLERYRRTRDREYRRDVSEVDAGRFVGWDASNNHVESKIGRKALVW